MFWNINMRIDHILNRHQTLGNNPYIASVLNSLNDGDVPVTFTDTDVDEYCADIENTLPAAFEQHLQIRFELNNQLLMVLVYHVLTTDYESSDTMAAIEFFMQATRERCSDISQNEFDNVFCKVLLALSTDVTHIRRGTQSRIIDFLQTAAYDLDKHFVDLVVFLKVAIDHDPDTMIVDLDYCGAPKLAKFAYCCAKALLERHAGLPVLENLFRIVVSGFCHDVKIGASHQNTVVFFQVVLKSHASYFWFKPQLLKALFTTQNPMVTVDLFKLLEKRDYESMVNAIINEYMTCSDEIRPYIQETMNVIIQNPYGRADYENTQRQRQVDRIVHQTCLRLSSCPLVEQQKIMTIFLRWYDCKDLNLRRTLQEMFNIDGEVSARNLFEILKENVDINWQNKSYNIAFLQLVLNMFYYKPEFMINHYVRVVEMLSFRGDASDIEHCLPYLTKVIQKYADKGCPVIKPLLGIITHFALIPTQTGKRYLFEVYNLISLAWDKNSDASVEFAILEVFLSPDMRCKELFCALETYFPMEERHLKVIFEERTLKYKDVAWAFLSLLLNRYEVTAFPGYFEHTISNINNVEFYIQPEAIYMVQCITKVYQMKLQKNKLTAQDKNLAAQLLETLYWHIVKCYIPLKLSNEVMMLINTLNGIVKLDLAFFISWKQSIMERILNDYKSALPLITARQCSYVAHYVGSGDMKVDNADNLRLLRILETDENIDPAVLSRLILLLGKICLKYPTLIHRGMPVMKKFLSHSNSEVKITTLSNFYDIANIRLQNFANFDTELLKLINYGNIEIQDATLKLLLELLGKDQVRLDRNGSVALMLAVVDRNINMDIFLKDGREKEQLLKSEKLIKNSFVYLLFYLNEFNNTKEYKVTLPLLRSYSYEYRCVIYRYLFKILQRQDQMNVLKVLCIEFVEPLYHGTIEMNYKTLMILKDCVTLVSYYAADNVAYMNSDVQNFYEEFIPKVQKLLVPDFNVKTISTEFSSDLRTVVHALLKTLCKIERVSKDLLPQIYNTITLLTEAYYDNILSIVNENNKIRDKFNIYHTYFAKYRKVILSEPISARIIADQEEWRQYTQEDL